MLQGPEATIDHARRLRKAPSRPEALLWRALRDRPGGLKFRRQHPSGPYVADFFCHAARLVVEVDGEAHDRGRQPARDAVRDRWFAARRFRVHRVPASAVLADVDDVVRGIIVSAERPIPLHRPAGGPLPPPGEDAGGED